MLLNGRYSDLERRIIDTFREELPANPQASPSIFVPERLHVLVKYLIGDGIVTVARYESGMSMSFSDGTVLRDDNLKLTLTPKGRQFISNLEH